MTISVQRDISLLTPESQILCQKQIDLIEVHRLPLFLFETLRTQERQNDCFKRGASKTLHSVHLTGDAWDFVARYNGEWRWAEEDVHWYQILALLTYKYVPGVKWGADWDGKMLWLNETFTDWYHYERKH